MGLALLAANVTAQDSLFAPAVNYSVGDGPVSIFAADLDGDGDNDLAVGNYNSDSVSILINRTANHADVVDNDNPLPGQFLLSQNYPNPFNPSTKIVYSIAKRDHVTISIYNLLGQQIRTIVDEEKSVGQYSAIWDGRDRQGRLVATGLYFYRLRVGDVAETKKMLLLK